MIFVHENSKNIKNSADSLGREANFYYSFTNNYNNRLFDDKFQHLEISINILENLIIDIENEKKLLAFTKITIENELNSIDQIFHHINNCSNMKCEIECNFISNDTVFAEIRVEKYSNEVNRDILINKYSTLFEHTQRLENLCSEVSQNLFKKKEALNIDRQQKALEADSSDISFKVDPSKTPKSCEIFSEDQWEKCTETLKNRTERELKASKDVRSKISGLIASMRDTLRDRGFKVDQAILQRLSTLHQVCTSLQRNKNNIEKSMKKLSNELVKLDKTYLSYRDFIKLTETRLDNRKFRPKSELVEDRIQRELTNQMFTLKQSERKVTDKIEDTKYLHSTQERQKFILVNDIDKLCIEIGTYCEMLKIRKLLNDYVLNKPVETNSDQHCAK